MYVCMYVYNYTNQWNIHVLLILSSTKLHGQKIMGGLVPSNYIVSIMN